MSFIFFPQTILKFCCAKHTRENKNHEEWDGVVCSSLNVAVKAAVHMYFEECRLKQERNTLKHTLDCTLLLICQSDSGGLLHSHAHFLVQVTKIGSSTSNKVQFLCCFPLVNQAKILSLPYLELIAISKCIDTGARLLQALDDIGLKVHSKNVYFCSDNKSSIQCTMCSS